MFYAGFIILAQTYNGRIMVTAATIFSALFSAVFLVIYWAAIVVGWLIAIPIVFLFVLWLLDFVKGTQYTSRFIAFLASYIPKPVEKELCPVCEQNKEGHPEEGHNYCYACGRHLAH